MREQKKKYVKIPEGITNEQIISSFTEEHKKHGDIKEIHKDKMVKLQCTYCCAMTMYIIGDE